MKQVIFDKEHPNGIIVEVEDEIEAIEIPFAERVVSRIRERYSIDDELAIHRHMFEDPKSAAEEFAEYNTFVETIKAEERDGN